MTGNTVIVGALQRMGVLGPGETLDAEDAATMLGILNRMVGLMNIQKLLPPVRSRTPYTWPDSTSTRTVGPSGAQLTGPRPRHLQTAQIIDAGQTQEREITILTPQRYQAWPFKAETSSMPLAVYAEPTAPNMTLTLLPTPTAELTLVLYGLDYVSTFANLATEYDFEDGYEQFFVSNLAELAMGTFQVPREERDGIRAEAADARGAIKDLNLHVPELAADPHGTFSDGASWNYELGEPY